MYCRVCSGRKFSSDAELFSASNSKEAADSTKSASSTDLESGSGDCSSGIGDCSSGIGDDCPDRKDLTSLLPECPLSGKFLKSLECPKSPLAGVGSPSNSNTPVRQCQNSGAECSIELSQGRDTHSNRVDSHICRCASMSLK